MSFASWIRKPGPVPELSQAVTGRRVPYQGAAARARPRLELLEGRTLLSGVSFSLPASYSVGTNPNSVVVGDFNGDGRPDLAVAGYASSVSVLLGNSDGTFQSAHNFAAGAFFNSLAVGDFNNDGKLDLALTNPSSGTGSVLLGNGDGSFQAATSFAEDGQYSYSLAVGDFNRDGKLDLTVANTSGVSVLLGNGDGSFQTPRDFAVGGGPQSVAVADFNGDGKPDLAVATSNGNHVSVLLGNGDGSFQSAQDFTVGGGSYALAVGDFNGDGKPDLAVTNIVPNNSVSVLLGNGDGTFQMAQNFDPGGHGISIAVGDFNGDGKSDLAIANNYSNTYGTGTASVLLGNGDGTFQTPQNFAAGTSPESVAVGDFNGDGKPDLAVADLTNINPTVSVLVNQLVTTTAMSGPTSSTYGQSVACTASVTNGTGPMTVGTITFMDGNTPLSPALPVDANGQATFSFSALNAGNHTITASYSGMPYGAGTTGYGPSAGNTSLVITPITLFATGVNVSPTAGAPFTGVVATFVNADPFGSATSYTAIITWGDGSTSAGTITGTGTLTVSGSHTYTDPGSEAVSVQISHNLGNTSTAATSATAAVMTLGQGVQHGLTGDIGFWHKKNGQALINGFNGGSNATALSSWLTATFPNLYGVGASANSKSLIGFTNAQVAAYYQSQFALTGSLEPKVLATALNVYATTLSLGGTSGQAYGFTVTAAGLGADSFNVGADGAAFGVAKQTTLNVYELLKAVDRQAPFGLIYSGDMPLRHKAADLFGTLITAGSIS